MENQTYNVSQISSKYLGGQYGCAILTKGKPLSEARMTASREGSRVASIFLSEEPYKYEFGRF